MNILSNLRRNVYLNFQQDKQNRSKHQIQLVVHNRVHELMFDLLIQFFRPEKYLNLKIKMKLFLTSISEIADLNVHDQLTNRVER